MTRFFKYGDHTIPDPGPQYSIKQVLQSLITYFPELAKATHSTKKLGDGRVEVTFQKQTTTKG
ncbi:MAG: PRTRC system protein C [Ardenticatenaceae bacterium]